MKKALFCFATILLCGTALLGEDNFANIIEKVNLNTPTDLDTCSYLGLKQNTGQFSLGDIQTDILIIGFPEKVRIYNHRLIFAQIKSKNLSF